MFKIILIFFLLFSFNFIGTAQEINNSGFEDLENDSLIKPKFWYNKMKYSCAVSDSTVKHTGKYSMHLKVTEKESFCNFYQKINLKPNGIQKYKLTAWIKNDSVQNGYASLFARIVNKDSSICMFDLNNQKIRKESDWSLYSMCFFADDSLSKITVGGRVSGVGNAWFDDFKIEIINDSTKCTEVVHKYMSEFFTILKNHSIRRDFIDLDKLQNICFDNLYSMKTTDDTYPLINYLLSKLGDNHSFFQTPDESTNYSSNKEIKQPTGKLIKKKFAYLELPFVMTMDSVAIIDFATNTQNLLKKMDKGTIKGWIIDLRNNSGGNCFPMIAGIGPLLGNGIVCYFIDVNNIKTTISYLNGASLMNDTVQVKVNEQPYVIKNNVPIAIIIGPNTASSGEIVALAFKGLPMSKLFGQPTYGVTTANSNYKLSDNATLILTTGIDADRNLKKYGGKIMPDVKVNYSNQEFYDESDLAIQEAIKWIENY